LDRIASINIILIRLDYGVTALSLLPQINDIRTIVPSQDKLVNYHILWFRTVVPIHIDNLLGIEFILGYNYSSRKELNGRNLKVENL